MALTDILTRLKTINGAITGITSAYDHTDAPMSLSGADLPAAISLPLEGDLSYGGGGDAVSVHRVRVLVYVVAVAQGTLAQNLSSVLPFLERFRDAYADAVKLDSLSGVNWAYLRRYWIGVLEAYGATDFHGIEFILEVEEQESVTVGL